MPAIVAFGLPFIPPAALALVGVVLRRHDAIPRWVGTLLMAVGVVGLLLVAAVKVWFLSTFDPS